MAVVLHGRSCHHHNHSHGQHNVKPRRRASGDDEMKAPAELLQIDVDDKDKTIQSEVENINVQAARLHVLGDFLQSVGVIVAAVIIKIYVSLSNVDGKFVLFDRRNAIPIERRDESLQFFIGNF